MTNPVGRPIGWRKKNSHTSSIMVRLTTEEKEWLRHQAKQVGLPESEIVRQCIWRMIKYHKARIKAGK